MKQLIFPLFLVVSLSCWLSDAHGQLADEWFNQKKTQRRYLAAQIAALRAYMVVLKDGYRIANNGISTIQRLKSGDFDIHSFFLSSLKTVSPYVRRHHIVLELAEDYAALLLYIRRTRERFGNLDGSAWQTSALDATYLKLAENLTADILLFADIISNSAYEMEDAERLSRIVSLQTRQKERKSFVQQLSSDFLRAMKHEQAVQADDSRFQKMITR